MFCGNCGNEMPSNALNCPNCGAPRTQAGAAPQSFDRQPAYQAAPAFDPAMLPPEYRPLSAWAYFGYTLLFSIPIVGFIFLIIFSISGANIHRRSFARSYWCALILAGAAMILMFIFAAITGVSVSEMANF